MPACLNSVTQLKRFNLLRTGSIDLFNELIASAKPIIRVEKTGYYILKTTRKCFLKLMPAKETCFRSVF